MRRMTQIESSRDDNSMRLVLSTMPMLEAEQRCTKHVANNYYITDYLGAPYTVVNVAPVSNQGSRMRPPFKAEFSIGLLRTNTATPLCHAPILADALS
jgi:hypothetical protein